MNSLGRQLQDLGRPPGVRPVLGRQLYQGRQVNPCRSILVELAAEAV